MISNLADAMAEIGRLGTMDQMLRERIKVLETNIELNADYATQVAQRETLIKELRAKIRELKDDQG